ncbi:MAG: orotidine-5'-phosphate decarboxylase [Candidatus Omnitrophota bacterium]|nr:orotidine-5'-phosphate decarboxylase [Candidatus Omnitrophota bacterium]
MGKMRAEERLIVALDVDNINRALELIDILAPVVEVFKVGIAPFTGFGHNLLEELRFAGKKCFLDLKFHDIPNTVLNAARAAAARGVFMINFHCLGGRKMLEAAVKGAKEAGGDEEGKKPLLLGVTVLTSMGDEDLRAVGLSGVLRDRVIDLAGLAADAGMDGVVASAQEARDIKQRIGEDFLVVTPGVRPEWAPGGDQKRILTPKRAISEGADYIVVGRPIIEADDPASAARKIIEEMGT